MRTDFENGLELAHLPQFDEDHARAPVVHRVAVADVVAEAGIRAEVLVHVVLRQPLHLGVAVKVIITPPCVFCMENR